jgi:hypothetical protein
MWQCGDASTLLRLISNEWSGPNYEWLPNSTSLRIPGPAAATRHHTHAVGEMVDASGMSRLIQPGAPVRAHRGDWIC